MIFLIYVSLMIKLTQPRRKASKKGNSPYHPSNHCFQFLLDIQIKVDRLQIILVAKKYIYVSQLFISRMPKMRAIPTLDITVIPGKIEDSGYSQFFGVNKVH